MATTTRIASDGKPIEVTDIPAGLSEKAGVYGGNGATSTIIMTGIMTGLPEIKSIITSERSDEQNRRKELPTNRQTGIKRV